MGVSFGTLYAILMLNEQVQSHGFALISQGGGCG